jgi:DNA-binding PadR family transcriptional regulator
MHKSNSFLPLSGAVFHILVALSEGERHGYGIIKEINSSTDGAIQLGPGTLYRSIKQLLADGWIEEVGEHPDPEIGGSRRRYYRLSDLGRRVAMAEARRLDGLVSLARSRHLLPEVEPA